MKQIKKHNRGTTFILLLIVVLVVGLWIVTVADLTSTSSQMEGRRVSFSMAVATADAGLERAFARYAELTRYSAGIPTPKEMVDGWEDADRAPDYTLNPGVTMEPDDVNILYMDGLGRIYRDDLENVDQMLKHNAYDAFNQRPVGRVGVVASASATADSLVGGSQEPLNVTVNRIYNRNGLPFPSDLAFYTHTLHMHAGPNMYLDGPLYSSKRIFGMTNSTTTVGDDVTTPPNFPPKHDANGDYIGAENVRAALQALLDDERGDEIEGFFYNEEVHGVIPPTQGNGIVLKEGVRHIQSNDVRYIFDSNNAEFKEWFGDNNNDGYPDNAWMEADNPNINGGYREIIERRDQGNDDTLFMAKQRLDNFADLKIYYDSSDPEFMLNDDGDINPDKVYIYYKKNYHWDFPSVPSDPNDAGYDQAVKKAIDYLEEKEQVPAALKEKILETMEFQPYTITQEVTTNEDGSTETTDIHDGFHDQWLAIDHGIKHTPKAGRMNLVNFDVDALSEVLEDWTEGNIPGVDPANFDYLPNEKNSDGELINQDLRGYVLYVSDDAANLDLDADDADYTRGIRLRNGSEVADGGLVVATDLVAYVEGDFNTGGTGSEVETNANNDDDPSDEMPYNTSSNYDPGDHPSGLFADSIRLLSSVWDDDKSREKRKKRKATHTTYNLAMIMGDRYIDPLQIDTGGLHNFPRFLEDWGGKDATISGAFVQLWLAEYNHYSYGDGGNWRTAYSPPKRHWRYDYNYYDTGGLRVPLRTGRNTNSFGRYWMTAGAN
jgi:hypothetical protein